MTIVKCIVCGVGPARQVKKIGSYALMRCNACDLVFCDPMKEAGSESYKVAESGINYWIHDYKLSWHHMRFLDGTKPNGKTLLDIGCGCGEFLSAAREKGYKVWGVDFVKEKIDVARKRYGLENTYVAAADGIEAALGRQKFDVVTFFEVLEHLDDPAGFLARVKGLLEPGGHIALSVPNRNRPFARFDRHDGPPHHLTRWSLKSAISLVERSGFKVVRGEVKRSDIAGYLEARTGMKRLSSVIAAPLKPIILRLPLEGRGIFVLARLM